MQKYIKSWGNRNRKEKEKEKKRSGRSPNVGTSAPVLARAAVPVLARKHPAIRLCFRIGLSDKPLGRPLLALRLAHAARSPLLLLQPQLLVRRALEIAVLERTLVRAEAGIARREPGLHLWRQLVERHCMHGEIVVVLAVFGLGRRTEEHLHSGLARRIPVLVLPARLACFLVGGRQRIQRGIPVADQIAICVPVWLLDRADELVLALEPALFDKVHGGDLARAVVCDDHLAIVVNVQLARKEIVDARCDLGPRVVVLVLADQEMECARGEHFHRVAPELVLDLRVAVKYKIGTREMIGRDGRMVAHLLCKEAAAHVGLAVPLVCFPKHWVERLARAVDSGMIGRHCPCRNKRHALARVVLRCRA
eukprot:comp21204_c0_seq2/m.45131 comp21204_c0_seq2/g.45131  ORF comp21204_c0_seq2/g.45131 comp21204_c0_seq2/m.45131 type:complete len:365 (+) comp21204_c0_seq2:151-1245(+)